MNTVVKAGIVLGVLVEIWTYLMGFTGWYKHPQLMNLFWVVIAIQIAVLMWALKRTAAEGRGYGGQIGAGTLVSLIAGVFVVGGSLVFTTIVFPHYFAELAAIQEQMLRSAGQTEADIRTAMELTAKTSTPLMQACFGFLGTMVTGVIVSAIIGAFVKAKPA